MALTKVTGHVVLPTTNIEFHNTKSTGIVTFTQTTQSTSTTTGALQIAGGVGIAKNLNVGGNLNVTGNLTYTDVDNINSTGIVTANAGIHLQDYIFHKGDLNTKLGFPGDDTIQFETSGHDRICIKSDGDIGFGTDTPAVALHHYADGNNGNTLRLENREGYVSFTNDADILSVDANSHHFRNRAGSTEFLRITSAGALGIGNLATSQNSVTQTSSTKLYIDSTKFTKIARLGAGSLNSAGWYTVAKVAAQNGNYFKCYASIGGDMTADVCVMELTGSYNASGALQNTYAEPVFKAHRTGLHSTDRITRARLVKDSSNILYLQIYIAGGVNNNTWGKSVLEYTIGAYSQNIADSGSAAMFAAQARGR